MFAEVLQIPSAVHVWSRQDREGILTSCHRWASNGWIAGFSFPRCTSAFGKLSTVQVLLFANATEIKKYFTKPKYLPSWPETRFCNR